MKKSVLLSIIFFTLIMLNSCVSMERQYQADADIIRMKHFDYYSKLLSDYHSIAGKYPFQDEYDAPAYVFIATREQDAYINDTNPYKHYTIPVEEFFTEISSVLGTEIHEKYDPQRVPNYRPAFYIYMIDGSDFYLAVHLNDENAFTKKIGKNYYKIELSNISSDEYKLFTYEQLNGNEDYANLLAQEPEKSGWFDELDENNKYDSRER